MIAPTTDPTRAELARPYRGRPQSRGRRRPLPIVIRLCRKKIYQSWACWRRRMQVKRGGIALSDARLLRTMRTPARDVPSLMAHFEGRTAPAFYWDTTDLPRIAGLVAEQVPQAIAQTQRQADDICAHIFDLLGSGKVSLGKQIDWCQDFKSGFRWLPSFCHDIVQDQGSNNADVKVPRELSRCHHFVILGKAYWYTRDEKYARAFVDQLTSWIQQNPPWMSVNWCSTMDVAIRMVNWIWAYHFFIASPHFNQNEKSIFFKSLLLHAQFISENLEYLGEFSDNHYLSNVVGLAIVGILFPEFKHARKWRDFGLRELFHEIVNQFHEDGVNFERSINYHRLTLEMVIATLLLCKKNRISVPVAVWQRVEKMVWFVLYYTKPDGMGPHIGDTDNGRLQVLGDTDVMDHRYLLSIGAVLFDRGDFKQGAGTFHEDALWLLGIEGWRQFEALAAPPEAVGSCAFTHGGFVFLRHQDLYMAIACGANGRRGVGNHSHNDALSFELYAYDKTFIVDPGTYLYTAAPAWRNRFRSTASHNTVMVDSAELNPILADDLFRLGPGAVPTVQTWQTTPAADRLEITHNGYERLPEPVHHQRQFYFDKERYYWIIRDQLSGHGAHKLEWFLHFNVGIPVQISHNSILTQCQQGANLFLYVVGNMELHISSEEGWVSPSYGIRQQAQVVHCSYSGELPAVVFFLLYPFKDTKQLETLPYNCIKNFDKNWSVFL